MGEASLIPEKASGTLSSHAGVLSTDFETGEVVAIVRCLMGASPVAADFAIACAAIISGRSILKAVFSRTFLVLIAIFAVISLPAGENPNSYAAQKTRILVDMLGKKVEVPEPLTRVALLGGPTGQMAYILGARSQLCAVTKSLKSSELVNLMDPTVKNLVAPRNTSGQVNVEELITADPQLVVAGDLDGSIVEKKTRIPVAYFGSSMSQTFDAVKDELRFYGRVFNKEARAEKYVAYLQKTVDLVKSRTKDIPKEKRKVVFNGYSANHLVTLGGDTFIQQHIELAGCRNAADTIRSAGPKEGLHIGLAEVSMEKVLGWNPDIMVIDFASASDVYADSRWKSINAVRNRAVYRQPVGVFIWDRPTAESAVLHPLWLAKMAYPERFKDIDMAREIKTFYRDIMSFNLSDEHVEAILSGKYGLSMNTGGGK
jgi:iron complex transport system substrate-binding protein